MRMKRSLVVLLVFVGLMAGYAMMAFAADAGRLSPVLDRIVAKKELVVGTAASMPPLNMTMKDGQIAGLEIDLVQMFANAMDVKLTLRTMPFPELLPALEAGRVDLVVSGMTITPERNLKFAFVGPYFPSGKSILTKQANIGIMKEVQQINNPDHVLVALKGSTSQLFAEKFFPKAKLVLTDDYDQAVAMVRQNKAHAMVADFPICQVSVFRYPDSELATLKKPLFYEPLGMALLPNDILFINWLQNSLNTLERSGQMQALAEKWFEDSSWVKYLR
jgi:polar amino acid transport system substrate-binding protein